MFSGIELGQVSAVNTQPRRLKRGILPSRPVPDFPRPASWTLANGADYYYDAVRAPWRLAMDYAWSCDSSAKSAVDTLATFFSDQGPSAMGQGYTVGGSSLGYVGSL